MTPIRVAVWGIGPHAERKILPAIAATEGLTLHGVCSRQAESVASASAQWSCRGWTDRDAMLADPDIDAVYVATPIALHAAHGRRVLEAGKHLWCEKPLSMSLADTGDLIEDAREAGLSIGEGLMFLYHAQFHALRRVLSENRLGRLLEVSSRFGIPPLAIPRFRDSRELGGGALFDVGCYPVAALCALFPGVAMDVPYARVDRADARSVDTAGQAVIECANGVVAHLEWRINSAYRNEIFLWGDSASVSTDLVFSKPADYEPVLTFRDAKGAESRVSVPGDDHFVRMLEAFRAMILDTVLASAERVQIAARARVLERIQQKAGW